MENQRKFSLLTRGSLNIKRLLPWDSVLLIRILYFFLLQECGYQCQRSDWLQWVYRHDGEEARLSGWWCCSRLQGLWPGWWRVDKWRGAPAYHDQPGGAADWGRGEVHDSWGWPGWWWKDQLPRVLTADGPQQFLRRSKSIQGSLKGLSEEEPKDLSKQLWPIAHLKDLARTNCDFYIFYKPLVIILWSYLQNYLLNC